MELLVTFCHEAAGEGHRHQTAFGSRGLVLLYLPLLGRTIFSHSCPQQQRHCMVYHRHSCSNIAVSNLSLRSNFLVRQRPLLGLRQHSWLPVNLHSHLRLWSKSQKETGCSSLSVLHCWALGNKENALPVGCFDLLCYGYLSLYTPDDQVYHILTRSGCALSMSIFHDAGRSLTFEQCTLT